MSDQTQHILIRVADNAAIARPQVVRTVALLQEGATIPFISRYRKEVTGGLDEVQIETIKTEFDRLTELEKRKESILTSIEEQGKLTSELRTKIESCFEGSKLEDLYLPYKQKRRTRATMAREKGLEPLAAQLLKQEGARPEESAKSFINADVPTIDEALAGARDIVAEWVSESEQGRSTLRNLFRREAVISTKVIKAKESEGAKYSDYFDMQTSLRNIPSHRLLAMVRGEREGFLRLGVAPDAERAVEQLERIFVRGSSPARTQIEEAVRESYKRLLKPSLESEMMSEAKERADAEAIRIFAQNLRQLLLSAPLGHKRVLAIDPGFRTGCKVVCLDAQGNLLHNDTIYPHSPQQQAEAASHTLSTLVERYQIEAIAVGDGTAGRETEQLVQQTPFKRAVQIFMVSEDGASVYSASPVAREEFPTQDVTVRGAVSIGRRLIDPLAELVKIDPKSIGVGQYQHDVDQNRLKEGLDRVVESCVNGVGVNLNTASKQLLVYVSGLGAALAQNIVDYRAANGDFESRRELLKVPRLGAKAFEQAAGFLRIPNSKHPLDNSAVHPEAYTIVERMAKDVGAPLSELLSKEELRQKINPQNYVTDQVGLPTLHDILDELAKPGLDPRSPIQPFSFADVHTLDDLHEGMVLPGIVTNITAFGAFVDVGVKQDGLLHISQITDRYVSNPADVLTLHEQVTVRVTAIDRLRSRISLSRKGL